MTFRTVKYHAAWTVEDYSSREIAMWTHKAAVGRTCGIPLLRASDGNLRLIREEDITLPPLSRSTFISGKLFHYGYDPPFGRFDRSIEVRGALFPANVLLGNPEVIDRAKTEVEQAYAEQDRLGLSVPTHEEYMLFIEQLRRGASGEFSALPESPA